MLSKIHIQNLALIEEENIEFNNGLTVISGETGAGKSIILDAINFVLGSRADKSLIRYGSNFLKVEALFDLNKAEIENLDFLGIEDSSLVISRSLNIEGKSDIRINGNLANLQILKQVSSIIVDFTKQNDNLSILNPKNYINYIDSFADSNLIELKDNYSELLKKYNSINENLKKFYSSEDDKKEKLDYLEYQINEIEKLNLSAEEEVELIKRKNQMHNSEKIVNSLKASVNFLSDMPSYNVLNNLNSSIKELNSIVAYSEVFIELADRLNSVKIEVEDISSCLEENENKFYFDSNEYESVENRLDEINNIKRKHGKEIEDILIKLNKMKEEYNCLLDFEDNYNKLILEKDKVSAELNNLSGKITKLRKEIACSFEEKIKLELKDLEMKDSNFKVEFSSLSEFREDGKDSIEFLFSANPGQNLKPIYKVISGGEMNRFLLAFKCILNKSSILDKTLIFDEIDSGISGKTGTQIAYKLKKIAKNFQVICISHLSQICAIADNNYLVSKIVDNLNTYSKIKLLNENDKIIEVARLNGGLNNTELSLNHAKELIKMLNE